MDIPITSERSKARWESLIHDDACYLCPRMCGARRAEGQKGVCGADAKMLVARAALHFWEEPPLSGDSGSGAVFFANCPLRCVYCQNSVIARGQAGIAVDAERLSQICLELESQGALNINFVTPTHYAPDVARSVSMARDRGLAVPIVWNTSGYERAEAVFALDDVVDIYLADFKYADAQIGSRYSNAPDYAEVALQAIEAMIECVGLPTFDEAHDERRMTGGVMVRHLLLPESLDLSKRALDMLYERFGNCVLYSIMNQYTPVMESSAYERFPELEHKVPDSDYEQLLDYADALGIDDYFWQIGPAAEESFIPAWDGQGVLTPNNR